MTMHTTTTAPATQNSMLPAGTLALIPLSLLHVAKLNVRKYGDKDIASLAASIASVGLLQPLVIRPETGSTPGYEVIAGQRRLRALEKLSTADGAHGPATDVPCVILTDATDGTAVEASLAENIERRNMDEFDQYIAFDTLIKQGRDEHDIAKAFNITVATVQKRLALARLIPALQKAYRMQDIDQDTLKLLTLAPKAKQKEYASLLDNPDSELPQRWQLKDWLLGGKAISTTTAIFPLELYTKDITTDLFGDAHYFSDTELFWSLQTQAITALVSELESKGWTRVNVLTRGDRFSAWDYEKRGLKRGGHAHVEIADSGDVTVHYGLLHRSELKKSKTKGEEAAKGAQADDAVEADAAVKPELSAPLANYIDCVRLSAVRADLIERPDIAVRLLLAHILAGTASRHIKVAAEKIQVLTTDISTTVKGLASGAVFAKARDRASVLMGNTGGDALIHFGYDHTGDDHSSVCGLFKHLLAMPDTDVMTVLATAMAETLALGSQIVDLAGTTLKTNVMTHWTPDDTFFELIRNKAVTDAVLVEVVGDAAAKPYLSKTAKEKKAIAKSALAGRTRTRKTDWIPAWMTFPQRRYGKGRLTSQPITDA